MLKKSYPWIIFDENSSGGVGTVAANSNNSIINNIIKQLHSEGFSVSAEVNTKDQTIVIRWFN